MVSISTILGLIFANLAALAVPVVLLVYTLKKGGTKNAPLFLLIGVATAMIVNTLPSLCCNMMVNIFNVNAESNTIIIIYYGLIVVLSAIALWLCTSYQRKTGFGLYKGLAVVSGQACYFMLLNNSKFLNYLSMLIGSFRLNSYASYAEFVVDYPEETEEQYNQLVELWQSFSGTEYFAIALSDVALIAAIMLIIFVFIKKYIEEKKAQGVLFAFLILAVAYFPLYILPMFFSGATTADEAGVTFYILDLIVNIILTAAFTFFAVKIAKTLPKEAKEKAYLNPAKKAREDQEARAGKRAWNEVNRLSRQGGLRSLADLDVQSIKTPSQLKAEMEEALADDEQESVETGKSAETEEAQEETYKSSGAEEPAAKKASNPVNESEDDA